MAKINQNKLAEQVTAAEGGKLALSIAQVKEVIRLTLLSLAINYVPSDVLATLEGVKVKSQDA